MMNVQLFASLQLRMAVVVIPTAGDQHDNTQCGHENPAHARSLTIHHTLKGYHKSRSGPDSRWGNPAAGSVILMGQQPASPQYPQP
jgi:hypothetical protein